MSPIEEGFSNSEFNSPGKKTIEDKISTQRDYLLKDLNENIEPLIKADNTQLIREYLETLRDKVKKRVDNIPLYKSDELINSIHDLQHNVQEIEDALPELDKISSEVREMLPKWKTAIETGEVEQEFLNTMNAKIFETSEMINGVSKNIEALKKLDPWDQRSRTSTVPSDAMNFYKQHLEQSLRIRTTLTPDDRFRSGSIKALKKGIEELKVFDQENPPHNPAKPEVTGVEREGNRVATPPGRTHE